MRANILNIKKKAILSFLSFVLVLSSVSVVMPFFVSEKAGASPSSFANQLKASPSAATVEAGTGVSLSAKAIWDFGFGWDNIQATRNTTTVTARVNPLEGELAADCSSFAGLTTVTKTVSLLSNVDKSFCYRGTALGPHIVTFTAVLPTFFSGTINLSTTATVTVVDTTAPSVPVNGQPNGSLLPTNVFDFAWTPSTDAGGGPITYEFRSALDPSQVGAAPDTSGAWYSGILTSPTIHSTGAPDGLWYWQARATDGVGNKSAWSDVWTVTLDTDNPTVTLDPIVSPVGGTTDNVTITGIVDDTNIASYRITIIDGTDTGEIATGGGAITPYDWNIASLASGTYTVTLTATDNALHTATITQDVVVDNTAPTASFDGYTGTDTTPLLTGAVDADASHVWVAIDGGAPQEAVKTGGTWSLQTTSPLALGAHSIVVSADDAVGNTSSTPVEGEGVLSFTILALPITSPEVLTGALDGTLLNTRITTTTTSNDSNGTSSDEKSEDTAILGSQTTKDSAKKLAVQPSAQGWNIYGLAWYWWLLVLVALAAIIWWFIARRRRNSEED